MFWDKYVSLCKKIEVSPTTIAKDLGVSTGTIAGWKKGAIPNVDALERIADYFDTTIDFLISDDEIFIKPSHKKSVFHHLFSIPQRWSSLRHGNPISDELMDRIVQFTNTTPSFLYSTVNHEYLPKIPVKDFKVQDLSVLGDIISVFDVCSDNADVKNLQIQLSHIIRYHLKNAGIDFDDLYGNRDIYHGIGLDKLLFLYKNITHLPDVTIDYGFNLTELDIIRENGAKGKKLSFLYMLTGKTYEDIFADKDKRITELEEEVAKLKAQLADKQ